MFDTNFPEAFSEEYAEYEQLLKEQAIEDARIAGIWMEFGFDEDTAFQFAVEREIHQPVSIEELLATFPPSS